MREYSLIHDHNLSLLAMNVVLICFHCKYSTLWQQFNILINSMVKWKTKQYNSKNNNTINYTCITIYICKKAKIQTLHINKYKEIPRQTNINSNNNQWILNHLNVCKFEHLSCQICERVPIYLHEMKKVCHIQWCAIHHYIVWSIKLFIVLMILWWSLYY